MNQSIVFMLVSFCLSVAFTACTKKDVISSYEKEATSVCKSSGAENSKIMCYDYEYDIQGNFFKVTKILKESEIEKTDGKGILYEYNGKGNLIRVSRLSPKKTEIIYNYSLSDVDDYR